MQCQNTKFNNLFQFSGFYRPLAYQAVVCAHHWCRHSLRGLWFMLITHPQARCSHPPSKYTKNSNYSRGRQPQTTNSNSSSPSHQEVWIYPAWVVILIMPLTSSVIHKEHDPCTELWKQLPLLVLPWNQEVNCPPQETGELGKALYWQHHWDGEARDMCLRLPYQTPVSFLGLSILSYPWPLAVLYWGCPRQWGMEAMCENMKPLSQAPAVPCALTYLTS